MAISMLVVAWGEMTDCCCCWCWCWSWCMSCYAWDSFTDERGWVQLESFLPRTWVRGWVNARRRPKMNKRSY